MKANVLKITAIVLMLAGSFSCGTKMNIGDEDSTEYLYCLPSSEKRDLIKTLKDEPGYISWRTDPEVDRIWYYYFELETPDSKFSERLHFWTTVGSSDINLDKYDNPNEVIRVKISGNVTNSLSLHKEWRQDCDSGFVTREFNILEVSSIKKVRK